jgi:hypothetical protein
VRLFGTNIGGGLECDGGLIEKPDGQARNFEQAQIGGKVLLRRVGGQPFTAKGTVIFAGARIAGILGCDGGCFENPGGEALIFDRAQIGGSVFLRSADKCELHVSGEVSLTLSDIKGNLDCRGGLFENRHGNALTTAGAKIGGYLLFRNKGDVRSRAAGTVRLFGTNIGGSLECDGGCFENPGGEAL